MRVIVGLLTLAIAAAAPAQQPGKPSEAPTKVSFSPEAADRWIPFERKNGIVLVEILINGKPVKAIIDNSATRLALSTDYVSKHGMRLTAGGKADAPGGGADYSMTDAPTLQLGGLTTSGGKVAVIDLSWISNQVQEPVDFVIAKPWFQVLMLQMDFDAHRLRFLPSGSQPLNGIEVPITESGDRLLIPVSIGSNAPQQAEIFLGQQDGLTLTEATASQVKGKAVETDLAASGVGGVEVMKLLSVGAGAIGAARFGPIVASVEGPGQYLEQRGNTAAVGLGLLSRYNFAFDQRLHQLTLAPRTTTDPMEAKSTVGIQVNYLPDRISILHVMSNSPAASAGLKQGDAICALDGVKITPNWRSGPMVKWSTGAPGHQHKLSLCDGRTVTLTSKAFY